MSKIKVMDEVLANKIAAGEVIEKMMNIVKELVENSIDAESDQIKIELIDSGTKMVKITDNGIGMDKEDATLAFSRHATSKCRDLHDLFNINSLGFRGEALPSIASISKVTLKTSNGKSGTLVKIEGGKVIDVSSADLQKGTTITVEDVFYNTPVRLKYIKNLYSELANVVEYVNKMALSYPNIKFTLINNDKTLLDTDGSGNLLKVIYEIYGGNVAKRMVEVSDSNDDYYISGYISYPENQRASRNSITTLINGRVIRNNDLIRIITDIYHLYMPKDKYPIVVLNIETDPILVDVNVHPTKMDVKFSKMDTLKELLTNMIKNKIKELVMIPDISVKTRNDITFDEVEEKEITYQETSLVFDVEEESESSTNYEEKVERVVEQIEMEEIVPEEYKIKEMIPRGIVYKTYIIAENSDGMYLIDQHAAAERVNFEKCMKKVLNSEIERVDMLIPVRVEMTKNEFLIVREHLDLLDSLGLTTEEFDENTFIVRTHPSWIKKDLEKGDIEKIFEIIAHHEDFSKEKFVDHFVATMACRMSIKANDYITLEEAEFLLNELRKCDNPFNCPHGRPTIITYTKYELEKMFKRIMD